MVPTVVAQMIHTRLANRVLGSHYPLEECATWDPAVFEVLADLETTLEAGRPEE